MVYHKIRYCFTSVFVTTHLSSSLVVFINHLAYEIHSASTILEAQSYGFIP